MFDNIRGETTSLFNDDDFEEVVEESAPEISRERSKPGKFLGMTSFQRFIIALMLMITACILGTMCLLLAGKIGLAV